MTAAHVCLLMAPRGPYLRLDRQPYEVLHFHDTSRLGSHALRFTYRTDGEWLAAMWPRAGSPVVPGELGVLGHQAFRRWCSREAHLDMYLEPGPPGRFVTKPWEA